MRNTGLYFVSWYCNILWSDKAGDGRRLYLCLSVYFVINQWFDEDYFINQYRLEFTWTPSFITSLASGLLAIQLVLTMTKYGIKIPYHWSFVREIQQCQQGSLTNCQRCQTFNMPRYGAYWIMHQKQASRAAVKRPYKHAIKLKRQKHSFMHC